MPTVIEIDDILEGYTSYEKIRKVYSELRKKVFSQAPIQFSPEPLIHLTYNNERGGNYGWEIYQQENKLCVMKYFGRWTGYAHESRSPPSSEKANLNLLKLTMHPENHDLERRINEIISEFPKESKKAS